MGARQSSAAEERPRANSVDGGSRPPRETAHSSTGLSSDFLNAIRNNVIDITGDSSGDEEGGSILSQANRSRAYRAPNIRRSNRRRSHADRTSHIFFSNEDLTCPVCHKRIPSDEVEIHLVMCLTRPRIIYNEEVLNDTKGECAICLEDMETGQSIARLPCLCIYHKKCIDDWFKRKNSCPEHPGD